MNQNKKTVFAEMVAVVNANVGKEVASDELLLGREPGNNAWTSYLYKFLKLDYVEVVGNGSVRSKGARYRILKPIPPHYSSNSIADEMRALKGLIPNRARKEARSDDAVKTQVGGSHYTRLKYQPVELFAKVRCNPFQANIIKYTTRYKYKDGGKDIKKAKHYAALAIHLLKQPLNPYADWKLSDFEEKELFKFCEANEFSPMQTQIVMSAMKGDYDCSSVGCSNLLYTQYPNEV